MDAAGYTPVRQHFDFPVFNETAPPVFERVSPDPATYSEGADFFTMFYSGGRDTTATLQATNDISISSASLPNSSNSGCGATHLESACIPTWGSPERAEQ